MKKLFCITALLISTNVSADFTQCTYLFANSNPPVYQGTARTIQLCNTEFATLYAPQVKTPLYSYMHVTSNTSVTRQGSFHRDGRLSKEDSSTNKDYTNSGYDRGHLTPSADASSITSQDETFSFSNIAPQAPKFNQQQWRILEAQVRNKFSYVITGVIYQGQSIKTIGNKVGIPTQFYKIVTDGKTCSTTYLADNKDGAVIQTVGVGVVERMTKLNFNLPEHECK